MKKCITIIFLLTLSSKVCKSEKFAKKIDDAKCDAQLDFFSESLMKRDPWAVEFFDSWTKFQSGVLFGNTIDFGNYEQCIDFKFESKDMDIGMIEGKHCMIFYRSTTNASSPELTDGIFDWTEIGLMARQFHLRLGGGVCMPSSCSTSKIQSFVISFLKDADLEITNDYDQSQWCVTNESKPFETIDIVCIVVLSILACLLLSSTAYELLMINRNHKPHELYLVFSVYKNGTKLFSIDHKSKNLFLCLSGIRTFAMLHILLGHRFGWSRGFPNVNSRVFATDGKWLQTSLLAAFINVQPIAVDSFFVIGGLLVGRSILNNIDKGTFNIPKMYLHRYLRITPVLGVLILIIVSILKFFGDGLFFNEVSNSALITACKANWWVALLHIQNYYVPCLGVSWYLSADFQLILISPLILYPAYKWGWKFLWILPTYITGVEIWVFIVTYRNGFKAARFFMADFGLESARQIYFPTHIRCGPWLIGIMLAYVFFQCRNRKIVIKKWVKIVMWILSLSVIIAILVGMMPLQRTGNRPHQVADSLWLSLIRAQWGYAIAWIILSCQCGGGGIFKWFLELPIWQPFGRMSLSFYLVHTIYQTVAIGSGKVPRHFDQTDLLHSFAGDVVVSTFFATILYLTLEEPIFLIENYIYKALASRKNTKL